MSLYKNILKSVKVNIHKKYFIPWFLRSQKFSIYTTDPIDPNEAVFEKILIANRGEIACRVIKTAKRMGIKTVAIHSDVDTYTPHVQMADEAICVGTAQAKDSYLRIDRILDAIDKTGSQAVHPGYGFLSENAEFVKKLEDKNILFIGPSAFAITGMGDKLESKRLAIQAGVNTIPGFDGIIKDSEECVKISKEIGYPVMIKASAGGGGKGMRIAWNDVEAREGFQLSKQEAASSFGDDRILVEKFVDKPRHIEIQILGDKLGNVIYLNERECSIQRRNQKVIEEAPSVYLDDGLRKAMGEQAVALAKQIKYTSAGTVEFLVDANKNFYFLEMNTRLQVEHPITECITGIDLVQQMFRIAKGHPLKIKQSDVPLKGWAIESRLYAEDPYKNFGLPSIGRLNRYQEPLHLSKVRCDSGVTEGSDISIYYDPMLCKLVCHGDTREEAIAKSVKALDAYIIRGVAHNLPLLRDILTEEKFVKGDITTNYLYEVYPNGFKGKNMNVKEKNGLLSMLSVIYVKNMLRSQDVFNQTGYIFAKDRQTSWNLVILIGEEEYKCQVFLSAGNFTVHLNDEILNIEDTFNLASPLIEADINGEEETVQLIKVGHSGDIKIRFKGTVFQSKILSEETHKYLEIMPFKPMADVSKQVLSPMPGLVRNIACQPGDEIAEGQEVCVIEAMKMQNSLSASTAGTVKSINVKVGQTVEEEEVLIELC